MVKTKSRHLKRMLHNDDQQHVSAGVDEADGPAVSTSRWMAAESQIDRGITRSHHSSRKLAGLCSSLDVSFPSNLYQPPQDFNNSWSNYYLRSHDRSVHASSFPTGLNRPINHGPIDGPIASAIVGPEGGRLELYGNVMTIPEGAVTERTKFELGLVWNKCLRPSFGSNYQMTSILSCQPSGVKFYKPVTLSLPHCLEIIEGKHIRPILYSSHHTNDGRPKWTRCWVADNSFTFQRQRIEVKVHDFCYLTWAFEDDRPDVAAKRLKIAPYASPIYDGQDQKIRLHIFDDVEALYEKVKKEEEELGGKILTSYHSYVLLKIGRNLNFEVDWYTVGWLLGTTPIIKIPFREVWACDHNSCELHFSNQGQQSGFNCHIAIQQEDNESKVALSFSHNIQMNSPDGPQFRAAKGRSEETTIISQEETPSLSRPVLASLQTLPDVPPPPDYAIQLLSITSTTSVSQAETRRKVRHCSLTDRPTSSFPTWTGTRERHGPLRGALLHEGVDQSMDGSSIHGATNVDMSDLISRRDSSFGMQEGAKFGLPAPHEKSTTIAVRHKNPTQSLPKQVTSGGNLGEVHVNKFYVNNMNVNVPQYNNLSMHAETKSVIPLQLKKQLSVKLDEDNAVKNWMDLSKHWKLGEYDKSAHVDQSRRPAYVIMTVAEERKIVRSLDDLRDAFRAIGRDDLVEDVDKYEGIYANSTSNDFE